MVQEQPSVAPRDFMEVHLEGRYILAGARDATAHERWWAQAIAARDSAPEPMREWLRDEDEPWEKLQVFTDEQTWPVYNWAKTLDGWSDDDPPLILLDTQDADDEAREVVEKIMRAMRDLNTDDRWHQLWYEMDLEFSVYPTDAGWQGSVGYDAAIEAVTGDGDTPKAALDATMAALRASISQEMFAYQAEKAKADR